MLDGIWRFFVSIYFIWVKIGVLSGLWTIFSFRPCLRMDSDLLIARRRRFRLPRCPGRTRIACLGHTKGPGTKKCLQCPCFHFQSSHDHLKTLFPSSPAPVPCLHAPWHAHSQNHTISQPPTLNNDIPKDRVYFQAWYPHGQARAHAGSAPLRPAAPKLKRSGPGYRLCAACHFSAMRKGSPLRSPLSAVRSLTPSRCGTGLRCWGGSGSGAFLSTWTVQGLLIFCLSISGRKCCQNSPRQPGRQTKMPQPQ